MKRFKNEINAGSMADIAFLLLIFFLVTTTIDVDKGITVKLPPWTDDPDEISEVSSKNIFRVNVNASDELLVRGERIPVKVLKKRAVEFILNPEQRNDMPKSPRNAIISLQNDRETSYGTYIAVYNELKAAYNSIWEEEALKRFGQNYESLDRDEKKEIRKDIPLVISEAEPKKFSMR